MTPQKYINVRDGRNKKPVGTAVQYLHSNLPYDVSLLQHAQYVHPDKRNASESLSVISNLVVKIALVLNNNVWCEECFEQLYR